MADWAGWVKRVASGLKTSLIDTSFLQRLYFALENDRKQSANDIEEILIRPHLKLSAQLEELGIQDSATARSRLLAVQLSQALIDEGGSLRLGELDEAVRLLEVHFYSIGPNRHLDTERRAHVLRALKWLQGDDRLQRQLLSFDAPMSNPHAQQLLRHTLQLTAGSPLTAAQTKRAVLAAWLTPLRQNVGSCFATAPAILIQAEQPWRFLGDLQDLLATGSLKRTIGGNEYTVPLCKSWGMGDLLRSFLPLDARALARSPGLQLAFEAAGLFGPHATERERQRRAEQLVREAIKKLPFRIATSEQLIRYALLADLGMTEEDLKLVVPSLDLAHTMRPSPSKREVFESRLLAAFSAFKGVTDCPLLKAWEFTLASFADVKADFSKWNLYVSLGLESQDVGGIAEAAKSVLEERIERTNREIDELNAKVEILYAAVRGLESRLRHASEDEARWLRMELQQQASELTSAQRERDEVHARGVKISRLLQGLVAVYGRLFPDYFQEVYDPDMHDVGPNPYEDSPAGFRLLFKHGRANTTLWTLIHNPEEFIQALSDFFVATEGTLLVDYDLKGLEREVGDLVTEIMRHVRSPRFLESAFYRTAVRHGSQPIADPLNHLDQIEKKPWSYVSGGTMTTLVSAYFSREVPPTLVDRRIESPQDLLIFLLDTLKEAQPVEMQPYLDDPLRSMLIQSPSHGFLLKPGIYPFSLGWQDRGNTSSWVREQIVRPAQGFLESIHIDRSMATLVLNQLGQGLPEELKASFGRVFARIPASGFSPRSFRTYLVETLHYLPWTKGPEGALVSAARIDALLFSLLPFTSLARLQTTITDLLARIFAEDPITLARAKQALDITLPRLTSVEPVSASQLQQMVQALVLLATQQSTLSRDFAWEIRMQMREAALALPAPILFADTNWSGEFFAFLVNPGTGLLDFWRTDYLGLRGAPMVEWQKWLDGSQKIPWSIYARPYEYTSAR